MMEIGVPYWYTDYVVLWLIMVIATEPKAIFLFNCLKTIYRYSITQQRIWNSYKDYL